MFVTYKSPVVCTALTALLGCTVLWCVLTVLPQLSAVQHDPKGRHDYTPYCVSVDGQPWHICHAPKCSTPGLAPKSKKKELRAAASLDYWEETLYLTQVVTIEF